MTNLTTAKSTAPLPSSTAHPEISVPTAVLCLVALITIPMVAYTLFVAMKCPRNPFRGNSAVPPAAAASCKAVDRLELVCGGVKYRKDDSVDVPGIDDQCPVCLSAFAEGEEIRQLGACRHVFHAACVDMWLYSHSNCPVCRAAVAVRRSRRVLIDGEDDFRQGLPDASHLI
ncbi:hypothetical protein OROGR_029480 [Orobanche gracilis]